MTPLLTAYLQAWKQYFDFSGQTTRDDFWWFMLAILVRRLHDTQRSGWWAWVFVIPVIGPFWLIYLLVQPSSSHFTDKALLS
ncbi:TPA: DUF805 domain-containing protein [Vibrio cholerae]